jgi:hypothetical protein
MGYGTSLAVGVVAVALLSGCGSRADIGSPQRTFASGTATPSGTTAPGGATGSARPGSSSPAPGATGVPTASGSAGALPKATDTFCDFPQTITCTREASVAADWWLDGAMLEGPVGQAHTYVLRSPRGFGSGTRPNKGDGSAFNIVVHSRGGDPYTTTIGDLLPAGALLISGVPVESNKTIPPNSGKPVIVRGQQGFVVTTPARDGTPPTRILGFYETVRGQRILWTAISITITWKTDEEVVQLLNGLRRPA